MISRIYIAQKVPDSRASLFQKSFNRLGLSGKVANVALVDSYTMDAQLAPAALEKAAGALVNPALETFSINKVPKVASYTYAIEIGFLPGVTDNVGHTAKEAISDSLRKKFKEKEAVYVSRVFFISGDISADDAQKIALSLHNPLIERAAIFTPKDLKKDGLPRTVPQVILPKRTSVISVPLSVSDDELVKIGKEGIFDSENGSRRGPLALDLVSMKVIQEYFKKLKRNPTDIELESLAQTWSEHCKHTIFANPITVGRSQMDAVRGGGGNERGAVGDSYRDEGVSRSNEEMRRLGESYIKDGLYKTYIKGATNLIRKKKGAKDFCLSVFSDNAGGIIFDDNYLVTHKMETHNSPSALDPFGGAITGIVGVNRDTIGFGLGAKPVANCYGFCFGDPFDTRPLFRDKMLTQKMLSPRRIMDGVIKGVNVGGNCSGIPTISGFVKFDDRFRGKPLVFVGTVGLMPRKLHGKKLYEKSAKAGDYIVMVGGRVGADGIHGATFSSVVMDTSSPATAVQIGDPITQKKLSDAIVKEARDRELYSSITDNGAGGLSCSVAEMAKECGGAKVDLEKVPLKYPGLLPWAIWISESQERMTLSVPKKKWKEFQTLMQSRGVEATIIGEFTSSGKCVVNFNGKKIMDIPLDFLHDGLPKRPLETAQKPHTYQMPALPEGVDRTRELEALLADGNIGSFDWISTQYDHEVQAGSVVKPLSGRGRINTDAQIFRPVLASKKGVVLSMGVYPSYTEASPYDMATCAIDTAVRNAVVAGGTLSQLAILDNTCWCSSYDKSRLSELVEAMRACYDTAVGYETPFISGKDSMFNDFKGYDENGNPVAISIPPTLLISAIGVVSDIYKSVTPEFKTAGDLIYILGETHDELGASEYFKLLAKKPARTTVQSGGEGSSAVGNNVPKVNIEKNKKTYRALETAISKGLVASSISVASGGLAVALAKASVGGMLGSVVSLKNLPGTADTIDAELFSESQGRILVSIAPKNKSAFEKIMKTISHAKIGTVSAGAKFAITDARGKPIINTTLAKLNSAYRDLSSKVS